MNRFHYSLASLVGLVCTAGVVLGTWRYSSHVGASEVVVLSIFAMSSATVAGIFGIEPTKRIWLPFAIFAWGYFSTAMTFGYDTLPGEFAANLVSGPSNNSPLAKDIHVAIESALSLVFGLLGTAACNCYWKLYGPGREPKRPGGSE